MLSDLSPYSAVDLLARDPVERIGYFEPYLYSNSLVLVYAPRGAGKSLWVFITAQAVATGTRCFDRKARMAKVLVIDGEMGLDGWGGRLNQLLYANHSAEFANHLHVFSFEQCKDMLIPSLSDPSKHSFYKELGASADVIIIDNLLTCSHPRDQRDDETTQWRRLQPLLIHWRQQGKCVVIIHHTAKAGQQYGTVLKENLMDFIVRLQPTQIRMPKDGLYLEVKLEKQRHLIGSHDTEELVRIEGDGAGYTTWGMDIDIERARFISEENPRNASQDRSLAELLGISLPHYMRCKHRVKFTDQTAAREVDDVLY